MLSWRFGKKLKKKIAVNGNLQRTQPTENLFTRKIPAKYFIFSPSFLSVHYFEFYLPMSGDNNIEPTSRGSNDNSNGPSNGSSVNSNRYSLNAPKYSSQPPPASHTYLPPMSVNIPPIASKSSSIYSLLHQSSPARRRQIQYYRHLSVVVPAPINHLLPLHSVLHNPQHNGNLPHTQCIQRLSA